MQNVAPMTTLCMLLWSVGFHSPGLDKKPLL